VLDHLGVGFRFRVVGRRVFEDHLAKPVVHDVNRVDNPMWLGHRTVSSHV
jgi:hypothetical protein